MGALEGEGGLRRPRSNTLGSSMLDVSRSDRQRLRADPDTDYAAQRDNACGGDGHAECATSQSSTL